MPADYEHRKELATRGSLLLTSSGVPTPLSAALFMSAVLLSIEHSTPGRVVFFAPNQGFQILSAVAAIVAIALLSRPPNPKTSTSKWQHLTSEFERGNPANLTTTMLTELDKDSAEISISLVSECVVAMRPHVSRTPPFSMLDSTLPHVLCEKLLPEFTPNPKVTNVDFSAHLSILAITTQLLCRFPTGTLPNFLLGNPDAVPPFVSVISKSFNLASTAPSTSSEVEIIDDTSTSVLAVDYDPAVCSLITKMSLLIGSLCDGGDLREEFADAGLLPPLIGLLSYFREDTHLINNVLYCLFNVCYESRANKTTLVDLNGVLQIVKALARVVGRAGDADASKKTDACILQGLGLCFDLLRQATSEADKGGMSPNLVGKARAQALNAGAVEMLLKAKDKYTGEGGIAGPDGAAAKINVVAMIDEMMAGLGVRQAKKQ